MPTLAEIERKCLSLQEQIDRNRAEVEALNRAADAQIGAEQKATRETVALLVEKGRHLILSLHHWQDLRPQKKEEKRKSMDWLIQELNEEAARHQTERAQEGLWDRLVDGLGSAAGAAPLPPLEEAA
jgi:hypothetical protein